MILAAAAVLLLATGCGKLGGRQAREVVFSVSATIAPPGTRTSYSDVVDNGKERIDWAVNDMIRIYCAAATSGSDHFSDYLVEDPAPLSTDATVSQATIKASGAGLSWGTGDHTFCALYPSPATTGVQSGVDFTDGTFIGVIPAAQTVTGASGSYIWKPDMNLAYMLARTADVAAETASVNLAFKPKFTALEFTVDSGENASVSVSGFSLQAADGDTGNYPAGTVSIAEADYETPSNYSFSGTSRTITVTFSPSLTVTSGHPVTFTVMALPRAMSGLSITFTGTEIGTRSLTLSESDGDPIVFEACKKYRIRNMSFPLLMPVTPGEDIIWDNTYEVVAGDSIVWGTGAGTENVPFDTGVPVSGDNINWQ
jgi:hypothetical protein